MGHGLNPLQLNGYIAANLYNIITGFYAPACYSPELNNQVFTIYPEIISDSLDGLEIS